MCVCVYPDPVGIYVVQPVSVSSTLIDQVKLVFVRHTDHVVIFPRRPVNQRHDDWGITEADFLQRSHRLISMYCIQEDVSALSCVCEPTRMYWNSSTGESAPMAMAPNPSGRGCFLVIRRSLFLMAATMRNSTPWCVLME